LSSLIATTASLGLLNLASIKAQAQEVSTAVELGQDFAVYRTVSSGRDASGVVSLRTNQFTLLENHLNYVDNGQWKPSEDLIEAFPDGEVARRGPNKAIFSPDLATDAVFDIMTFDGKRLRGGVRAIQLTDVASGKNLVIGTVKKSVPGQLLPPNQLLFADAFDGGIHADVLYIWKHNAFCQDVILKSRPNFPAALDPVTTRLEVVSEFVDPPEAAVDQQTVKVVGGPDLVDDAVIRLGTLSVILGRASLVDGQNAVSLGTLNPADGDVPVLKRWQRINDGRVFLIESVGWTELQDQLKQLPAQAGSGSLKAEVQLARSWPDRPASTKKREPVQIASAPYSPNGCVFDFFIIPDQGTPTTLGPQTYYIKTSYYSGSAVTIGAGCVVKYKNNANMTLYGTVSFPTYGVMPIFTSRNDDINGDKIQNVTNEPDSDGDPTKHQAAKAVWIYYLNFGTTIRNSIIRWAQRGVQLDANSGVNVTHTISGCKFEHDAIGVYENLPSGSVSFATVTNCDVATTRSGSGGYSGWPISDCGATNFPLSDLEHESTVAVNPSNPSQVAIFAATLRGFGYGLLEVASLDGGKTWGYGPVFIATGPPGLPEALADVQAAYDAVGNLFLCYTTPNNASIELAKSRDGGLTWTHVQTFIGSGSPPFVDRPIIATGPGGNYGTSSVWIMYIDGNAEGHLTVAGAPVGSDGNLTSGFISYTPGDSTVVGHLSPVGTGLAVGPTGKVLMAYESRYEPILAKRQIFINVDADGLGPTQPTLSSAAQFQVFMDSFHNIPAMPNHTVSRVPIVAWDRNPNSSHSNRKYLAFADTLTAETWQTNLDIYVRWSDDDSGATATWSSPVRINDDSTLNSQFLPGIAVDQTSGRVAVSWYDCRNDNQNRLSWFFAAVSTDFATPPPRNCQLSITGSFPIQANCPCCAWQNYGDYSGLAFHGGYVFPSWCSFANDSCGDVNSARVAW
jgi:hypothetical protein